jgi:alpha-glucosidase
MHSPQKGRACRVSFAPGKEFRRLTGEVGIGDYTFVPQGAVVFAAPGDGRKLWESEPLARNNTSIAFEIDVTGVEVLTLETGLHDGDQTFCHAIWLDPMLER